MQYYFSPTDKCVLCELSTQRATSRQPAAACAVGPLTPPSVCSLPQAAATAACRSRGYPGGQVAGDGGALVGTGTASWDGPLSERGCDEAFDRTRYERYVTDAREGRKWERQRKIDRCPPCFGLRFVKSPRPPAPRRHTFLCTSPRTIRRSHARSEAALRSQTASATARRPSIAPPRPEDARHCPSGPSGA